MDDNLVNSNAILRMEAQWESTVLIIKCIDISIRSNASPLRFHRKCRFLSTKFMLLHLFAHCPLLANWNIYFFSSVEISRRKEFQFSFYLLEVKQQRLNTFFLNGICIVEQLPIWVGWNRQTFFHSFSEASSIVLVNVIKHFRKPTFRKKNTHWHWCDDFVAWLLLLLLLFKVYVQLQFSCNVVQRVLKHISPWKYLFFVHSRSIFVYFSHLFWPNAILFGCMFCLGAKSHK